MSHHCLLSGSQTSSNTHSRVSAHLHDSCGGAHFDGVAQRRASAVHLQPTDLQTCTQS